MIKSSQPRSQRKFRYTSPLHVRQHFVRVHISKEARTKSNTQFRTTQISKGDTVKVMAGSKKGTTGKVSRVDIRKGFVYIDGLTRKNARGRESRIPIRASNLYITELNLSDKRRSAKLLGSSASASSGNNGKQGQ